LQLSAGLVIASSAERTRIAPRRRGERPPIAGIPNPLDADEWKATDRAAAREALGLSQDAFIAINHGRIDIRRKGHDTLLKAWAKTGGDQLVVIGSGQDHDAFASLLAESGLANVRWLSDYTTDRPLIRRWLSAADVYVTCSRIEGMPVAPLEAMACGLPIVATDAQGLPDILEGGEAAGGLILPRDDVAGIAAAIERLRLDPELRARLGRAARTRIETAFSIPAVADAFRRFVALPAS
jgi:starch synthase